MSLSPELITFFSAMTPFVELKLAIPLGLKMGLSVTNTFIFAVSGTILPAAFVLAIYQPMVDFLKKHNKYLDKMLTKLLEKTQKEHSTKFKRYGAIFLILFVAIPLPGSGAMSGATISYIFGIEYWKAVALISLGSIIAGIILMTGFESAFFIFHHRGGLK